MNTNVSSCDGCVHEHKHAMAFPCRDCDTFDHYTDGVSPQAPPDLEVWRQAYNAYLPGYHVAAQFEGPGRYVSETPCAVADQALADYQAKRKELSDGDAKRVD